MTREEFIKQRMDIDKITRRKFEYLYEVKVCNCGMPYCKGFVAKEKKQKLSYTEWLELKNQNYKEAIDKIRKICDSVPYTWSICGVDVVHKIEKVLEEVE